MYLRLRAPVDIPSWSRVTFGFAMFIPHFLVKSDHIFVESIHPVERVREGVVGRKLTWDTKWLVVATPRHSSSFPDGMFWRFVPRPKAFSDELHLNVSVPATLKEHFIRPLGSRGALMKVL